LHAVNPNTVTRTKMNKLAICLKCLSQQHVGKRDSLWQGEINNPEPCRPECTSISKAWQKRPLEFEESTCLERIELAFYQRRLAFRVQLKGGTLICAYKR